MAQMTCVSWFLVTALLTLSLPRPQTRKPQHSPPVGPSIGFAHVESVSPVVDIDVLADENGSGARSPKDSSMKGKRAIHETLLMDEFLAAFRESDECNGIAFYENTEQGPAFTVQIGVRGHDKPALKRSWTWILGYPGDRSPANSEGHGMGGMGSQPNARLTARDVCRTIWNVTGVNNSKKPVAIN